MCHPSCCHAGCHALQDSPGNAGLSLNKPVTPDLAWGEGRGGEGFVMALNVVGFCHLAWQLK
jgi:hypothetical protein